MFLPFLVCRDSIRPPFFLRDIQLRLYQSSLEEHPGRSISENRSLTSPRRARNGATSYPHSNREVLPKFCVRQSRIQYRVQMEAFSDLKVCVPKSIAGCFQGMSSKILLGYGTGLW